MKKLLFKLTLTLILAVASVFVLSACTVEKSDEALETVGVEFTFTVRGLDGSEETFELESTETYLVDALLEEGLIEGERSDAGFILSSVNGTEANTAETGNMWYLYINNELSADMVGTVPIVEGNGYSFVLEPIVNNATEVTVEETEAPEEDAEAETEADAEAEETL